MTDELHRTETDDKGGGANWPLASLVEDLNRAEAALSAATAAKREAMEVERECSGRVDRVRSDIATLMQESGVLSDRVNGHAVSLRPGRQSLVIDDPNAIPDEFYETEPVLRRDRVKARLVSGQPVQGAHLETGEPVVSIKWSQK